jgi:hypothetical protein
MLLIREGKFSIKDYNTGARYGGTCLSEMGRIEARLGKPLAKPHLNNKLNLVVCL